MFFDRAILKMYFLRVILKICFSREQFWKRIQNFLKQFEDSIFLRKRFKKCSFQVSNFENVFFEGTILKELMKKKFFFRTHFFNKSPLTFVIPTLKRGSLKIRKVTSETINFIYASNKTRIIHIPQQIWEIKYL